MKRLTIGVVGILVWSAATLGFAANLGTWALTADSSGATDEPTSVTVGNFIGGSGINAITFGNNGGWASGWSTDPSLDSTDYFEVTVAPQSGYSLIITDINYSERRSKAGIGAFQVRSSVDNFSSYTLLASETVPDNDGERSHSIPGLNITVSEGQTFTLRFYGYQAESGGGTWRIGDNTLTIVGDAVSMTGVPTISFNPSSGVQVHVSNTLEVAVSVFPPGSGIQSWFVDPTPAGSTSLTGGTFSFTPAEADDGQDVTLNVVATNSYGTTTGMLDIAVTEYLLPGSYEITFDNTGEVKTSYAAGAVSLNGRDWILDQARIGDTDDDLKIGLRSLRFGSYYEATMSSSNILLPDGLGNISFLYAQYGDSDAGAELVVEVAESGAPDNWLEVGRVDANGVTELTSYETLIGINEEMYLRIRTIYTPGIGQVNVDSILITPYVAPVYTAYEEFLREYNVTPGDPGTATPGDPGTATGDDLDGDGWTNQQEFDNYPTNSYNPYDKAIHP